MPGAGRMRRMYELVWDVLTNFFCVPKDPPSLPAHGPVEPHAFQPDPGFLRYLKFQFWILLLLIDGIVIGLWILLTINWPLIGILLLPVVLVIAFLPDVIAYVGIHLRYDTTWYVMSDRSVRIRRGIWSIRETTITYENVQNVAVKEGPLQRYYGIANVTLETAGGGGATPGAAAGAHVGLIEGVADAGRIRDMIMDKVRQSRRAGLGDEGDDDRGGAQWTAAHVESLRAIREQLAALGGGAVG